MEPSKDTEINILKEILKWTRFSGMQQLRQILNSSLPDNDTKVAYQLSDGTRGLVEIGSQVSGIKKDRLSKLWKNWARMGLGDFIPARGGERFRRLFDLEEVGIEFDMPQIKPEKQEGPQALQPPRQDGTITDFGSPPNSDSQVIDKDADGSS